MNKIREIGHVVGVDHVYAPGKVSLRLEVQLSRLQLSFQEMIAQCADLNPIICVTSTSRK